jgi:hypothetical protein
VGTPARTNILLEIKSALEGITVANGYNTEVTAVSPTLYSRDEYQKIGTPPVICFGAGDDRPKHHAFQDMRVEMPVVILGYIQETDWTTRSANLNLLIDDIIAKLSSDPTLNSNAVSIYFESWGTDEADPDATTGFPDGAGTCIVELRIPYYRTVNAS